MLQYGLTLITKVIDRIMKNHEGVEEALLHQGHKVSGFRFSKLEKMLESRSLPLSLYR